jgi:hypothetical protein
VTRNDNGRNGFNTSEIIGVVVAKSLSNTYYPVRDRGLGETFNRSLGALLSDAASNELREFWPDIRKLFKKHEPDRMKKLEERMPKAIGDAAGAAVGAPPPEPAPPEPAPPNAPAPQSPPAQNTTPQKPAAVSSPPPNRPEENPPAAPQAPPPKDPSK